MPMKTGRTLCGIRSDSNADPPTWGLIMTARANGNEYEEEGHEDIEKFSLAPPAEGKYPVRAVRIP